MPDTIDTVVLAGGGLRGLALLGALQQQLDAGRLEHVRTYAGTSVGAIIAYLLVIGFTPIELFVFFYEPEGVVFFRQVTQVDVSLVWRANGLIDMNVIAEALHVLTRRKLDTVPTLQSLHDVFQKDLVCVTFHQTRNRTEMLRRETHGDLSCIDALCRSAALPFLFTPVRDATGLYLDGAISHNFPVDLVMTLPTVRNVLAIRTQCAADYRIPGPNVMMTAHNLAMTIVHHQENHSIRTAEACCMRNSGSGLCIISVPITSVMVLGFPVNPTESFDLFSCGYQTARECGGRNRTNDEAGKSCLDPNKSTRITDGSLPADDPLLGRGHDADAARKLFHEAPEIHAEENVLLVVHPVENP